MNQVDIISISWIITAECANLREAIKSASATALIFCSTADFGAQAGGNIWPAHYNNIIAVSASNSYGLPRAESDRDVHIMYYGDRVRAEGPRYMNLGPDRWATGSSVSTALAAGLGSLWLALARMANSDNAVSDKRQDRLIMLAVFRKMQVSDQEPVIFPALVFGDKEAFAVPFGFEGGNIDPPTVLDKFGHHNFESVLKDLVKHGEFSGAIRRRNRSRDNPIIR